MSGGPCVLVVDDETVVRMLVTRALESAGYSVVGADDGEQALELLEGAEIEIDIVLTDISMPKLNGLELGRRIAAMNPPRPIVYMSAALPDTFVTRGADLTVAPFLLKPFSIPALVAAVTGLLTATRPKRAQAVGGVSMQERGVLA